MFCGAVKGPLVNFLQAITFSGLFHGKRGTVQYVSFFPLFYFKEERENPTKRSRIDRDIDNNLITSTPQTGEKPNKQLSRVRRKSQMNGGW